jgi:hypothetical protein
MGKITPFRQNEEDGRIMALIREHLTETIGEPSESDCIRFALRAASRELKDKPKPRAPRPHK